ncbi:MAG: metal-sensitive transcriptional regulator [Gemmataceae bacterium]
MDAAKKKRSLNRVKRIAGQLAGVQKMLEGDRYCLDILNQIAAVRSALDAMSLELISSHLETCLLGQGTPRQHPCAKPMSQEELLAEVRVTLSRFLQ